MFEKVNPAHPDKLCDRIAGAIVDEAYSLEDDPKIAVEVLLGHRRCSIVIETSVLIPVKKIYTIVKRIAGKCEEAGCCICESLFREGRNASFSIGTDQLLQ